MATVSRPQATTVYVAADHTLMTATPFSILRMRFNYCMRQHTRPHGARLRPFFPNSRQATWISQRSNGAPPVR
ncbi:hypothetical protein CBM2634_P200001 [Cupriavidus taiwanensis]|uniref:Uncharacterized protein n=1 Tax=Cupriavidus taiwanensis TaxID=164546 RepID=A0A375JCH1_9BURK|nr:hypothetical protein CBM2634_P200001 [Cupriavidus taiwanensis]